MRPLLALALAAALGSACTQSHGGPTLLVLRLTSVAPAKGSSFGGTNITISGAGFGTTATVTVGGLAAMNVAVSNSTTITATTPQHAIGGSDIVVPADLPVAVAERVRSVALDSFRALELSGMARVDCFLTPAGEVLVNEVNTIPGMTAHSQVPRMFASVGLSYSDLLDELVRGATPMTPHMVRLRA